MYNYEQEKQSLYSDEGMDMYIKVRDRALNLLSIAGAAKLENIISTVTGDSFMMLACVDRLVEKEVLREIHQNPKTASQNRLFCSGRKYK